MEHERHPAVGTTGDGAYVVLPLGDEWSTFVRFAAQDGHPVVAEVRIIPRTDRQFDDVTSADWAAFADATDPALWAKVGRGSPPPARPVPAGGLTTRALREVHLGRALALAYSHLDFEVKARSEWTKTHGPGAFGATRADDGDWPTGVSEAAIAVPRLPGRKGRDDRFYAVVAAAYVEALTQGSHKPVVLAAESLTEASEGTFDPAYVRDLLHAARRRGLLTRPPKGRAGGRLTSKALALLQQESNP